jgi:alkylated DNA repair protein (DNA oxidative demethylase)
MSQTSLWPETSEPETSETALGPGAIVLRGLARGAEAALLDQVAAIAARAPFRHLTTPGGHIMSVAMTNAGALGWISEPRGYRYVAADPLSGHDWPPIPALVRELAARAAARTGFDYPEPDACLVNRYAPGSRLSLHQDRDEKRLGHPIVSFSLGLPATFLFGGPRRGGPVRRVRLDSGDVVVFGGPSRMAFHGVAPLADGQHPLAGRFRYNLTLRHAG